MQIEPIVQTSGGQPELGRLVLLLCNLATGSVESGRSRGPIGYRVYAPTVGALSTGRMDARWEPPPAARRARKRLTK